MRYIFLLVQIINILFFGEVFFAQNKENIVLRYTSKIVNTDSIFISVIWDVCIDSSGNVYILDSKDYSVKKFDINGNFIRKFGKQGKGPSEFILPTIIRYSHNKISVYDHALKRFSIFNLNGKYLSTHNISDFVDDFQINKSGEYYIETTNWETQILQEGKTDHKISIYNKNFSFVKTIYEVKIKDRIFVKRGDRIDIDMFRFSPSLEWKILDNGNIVAGVTNQKNINLISPDGNLLKVIKPTFTNEKITIKALKHYYSDEIDFGDGSQHKFNEDVLTETLRNIKYLPYFNSIYKYGNKVIIQTFREKGKELKFFSINYEKNTINTFYEKSKIFYNQVRLYGNTLISFNKGMFFKQPVLYKYYVIK